MHCSNARRISMHGYAIWNRQCSRMDSRRKLNSSDVYGRRGPQHRETTHCRHWQLRLHHRADPGVPPTRRRAACPTTVRCTADRAEDFSKTLGKNSRHTLRRGTATSPPYGLKKRNVNGKKNTVRRSHPANRRMPGKATSLLQSPSRPTRHHPLHSPTIVRPPCRTSSPTPLGRVHSAEQNPARTLSTRQIPLPRPARPAISESPTSYRQSGPTRSKRLSSWTTPPTQEARVTDAGAPGKYR